MAGVTMTKSDAPLEFYGFLGRFRGLDTAVELRCYPFEFSVDRDAKVVFVVRFDEADFRIEEITPLLDDEVEVLVFQDRTEIQSVFKGTTAILRARSVTPEWSGYDTDDLLDRVRQMQGEHEHLNSALTQSIAKNRSSLALVQELRRRAEIKAAASEYLRLGQASALAVLDRLARHLESDD
jgi:hypothetical protein